MVLFVNRRQAIASVEWFFRLQVAAVVVVVAVLVAGGLPTFERPTASGKSQEVASAVERAPPKTDVPPVIVPPALPPAVYEVPAGQALPPRASMAINVHVGPSPDYVVMGVLPRGAQVQVLGRDSSGEWLAIAFPPNSTLTAWVHASVVADVGDVGRLKEVPVRLIP